jgi:hypothetical protein
LELPRRIAGYGLPSRNGEGSSLEISAEAWPLVLAVLRGERITGLAVAAWEDGWLRLTDGQTEELIASHRDAMLSVLALERELLSLASEFDRTGIQFTVLKGSAFAHSFYPDPSWRSFGDIDLLVSTGDWRRASQLLEGLGVRRRLPEPRAGFDERFGKAAEHVGSGGLEVDLHRTLVLGPFGLWIDPDELAEHTDFFALGGRRLRRLDDTAAFAHACMHASLGLWPPRLAPLRDVLQIGGFGRADWEMLAEWARRWRLAVVFRHALSTAEGYLSAGIPEPAEALRAVPSSRRESRALLAYTTNRRRRGGTALATLQAIPGLKAKAAYVRTLLLPNRAFLAARAGGGSPTYRRRWSIAIRWLRARVARSGRSR